MCTAFRRTEEVYNQAREEFLSNNGRLSAMRTELIRHAHQLFDETEFSLPVTLCPKGDDFDIPNFVQMSRYFMEGRWNYRSKIDPWESEADYEPINVQFCPLEETPAHDYLNVDEYPFQPALSPSAAQRRDVRYWFHRRAYLLEEISNQLHKAHSDIAGVSASHWINLFELTAFIQKEGAGLSDQEMRDLQATHSWTGREEPPAEYMPADSVLTFTPLKDPWALNRAIDSISSEHHQTSFASQTILGRPSSRWHKVQAIRIHKSFREIEFQVNRLRDQFAASNRSLGSVNSRVCS
ncbi:MAG: hypothetical protein Q9160_002843 [Pyrenula sp. 1 TL-2023]